MEVEINEKNPLIILTKYEAFKPLLLPKNNLDELPESIASIALQIWIVFDFLVKENNLHRDTIDSFLILHQSPVFCL